VSMINVKIEGVEEVNKALKDLPGKSQRACASALNTTAYEVLKKSKEEVKKTFDRPVPFTIRSAAYDKAKKDNLEVKVYYAEPERMKTHYLVPQVEGGSRKLKGFERALDLGELVPAMGAKIDKYGNISSGQIRQILSVLGKAEGAAGYSANITGRSRKRNAKDRDYVLIKHKHGKLYPGVYQRFQTGVGFGAKTKRTFADRSRSYQKGITRGRYSSVIRARGLRPILIQGRTGHNVKPQYDFYGMANNVINKNFVPTFLETLDRFMKS